MDLSISVRVTAALKAKFRFKSEKGKWLQSGKCPDCGRLEAYCAAEDAKIVRCGRTDNCGWEASVRDLFPEIFEDWTKLAPPTRQNPNASADAYLGIERGLPFLDWRGHYSQEYYKDPETGIGSATVRFPVGPYSWWERIIDRPGRFGMKARFKWREKNAPAHETWAGHCWVPPDLDFPSLAAAERIWITEGIFDCGALRQIGLVSVSAMSTSRYPEHFFEQLATAVREGPTPKNKPLIIIAYDVGPAGVTATKKHVAKARLEGWEAVAAQVRPDGEGPKLDWNDLWLRHRDWKGDDDKAPLSEKMLETYLWNGKVTIATTVAEKAELIRERWQQYSFPVRFENQLYWVGYKDEDGELVGKLQPRKIADCAFQILYRERNEVEDSTDYFIQIDFPGNVPTQKARFSASSCAASSEFKKRLMAFGGMWWGSGIELDRIMSVQSAKHKIVRPLHFTGYSPPDKAWVLGELAVREGRVYKVNTEKYFDFGKGAVKLQTRERMLEVEWNADRFETEWIDHIWQAWGARGLITVAFFTMSFFAVQIREKQKSLGFLEITGEPGSGKTTLVEFCWKLCGRTGYEGFDPNKGTLAFTARNFMKVSGLPVGLIESGRNDDKRSNNSRQFDYNELLTLYNGRNPRGLGAKSSGTETFEPPFLGSIYLMQNERIEAMEAVLERLMSFTIDKSGWSPDTRKSALQIENWPLDQVSGTIIQFIKRESEWLAAFFSRFDAHEQSMASRVREARKGADLHNSRIVKCHSQLAAAVEAMAQVLPISKERVAAAIEQIDAMALDRQQSTGSDHPIVQRFWEQVDHIIAREDDNLWAQGKSLNKHRKRDRYFAISMTEFEARANAAGLRAPTFDELRRHLKSSRVRKFVAVKGVAPQTKDADLTNTPDVKKNIYCWVFERPTPAANVPERII